MKAAVKSSGGKNGQTRISGRRGEVMYESRCGVCCNSCERKEAVHCTGCLTMENRSGAENAR